ncbi:2-oxo acid dehydrogenase subunit E2 [Haloglomus litoreum]|uniref:2-oxo acid dehydrogenase subunit E2 n=1 Tax=Haloglomus litoreum TaxID=3034026 RepID=UPI0023E832F7|nr:2-oxo acid dehydrogenase subunit E2 [Haloglomus sp. DT116]
MSYIVRMPKLGMEMESGVLLDWHVAEGDAVTEDEVIAEIESEKTRAEVPAREDGVLDRTYLEPGDEVPPGTPMGIVATDGADVADLAAEATAELDDLPDRDADASAAAPAATADAGPDGGATADADADGDDPDTDDTAGETKVTPRGRKVAEELGVDPATVEGTGFEGAVGADDIRRAAEAREAADDTPAGDQDAPSGGGDGTGRTDDAGRTVREERPFDGMRRTIAERLGRSAREAVHVTVHRELDAEAAMAAVDAARAEVDGETTLTDLLLVAVSRTLDDHPEFNATVEDETLRLYEEHNLGVAVDVEGGLVTPVLDAVNERSLGEVVATRRDLVGDVVAGDYDADDLSGGTFTLSNLGPFGADSFTPVIDPPQVAILGVDRVRERAVPDPDGEGDAVTVRRQLGLDLSFDHRAVDGADAARFLDTLATRLESPATLLPEGVTPAGGPAMPDREVSAHTSGGMHGEVRAGGFAWQVDEPVEAGGGGTAPTPVDRFLGSLAACLALSVEYQADIRDVALESVDVDVSGTPKKGKLESIVIRVAVDADADADTLDRIVDLAERGCFVADLLREDLDVSVERVE